MITLLDVISANTAIDAICNLNSGTDEMTRNESQFPIFTKSRKKFCRAVDIISDDAEIDEFDPSEFEMNRDNFMLPVIARNLKGFD